MQSLPRSFRSQRMPSDSLCKWLFQVLPVQRLLFQCRLEGSSELLPLFPSSSPLQFLYICVLVESFTPKFCEPIKKLIFQKKAKWMISDLGFCGSNPFLLQFLNVLFDYFLAYFFHTSPINNHYAD